MKALLIVCLIILAIICLVYGIVTRETIPAILILVSYIPCMIIQCKYLGSPFDYPTIVIWDANTCSKFDGMEIPWWFILLLTPLIPGTIIVGLINIIIDIIKKIKNDNKQI